MREYFEAEMRLLHEAAQSFAKAFPEQAGLLNLQTLRDRDPSVERLLEGFAYLTAQIKRRIDDELPEISAQLLSQFWPQFLRPYPSATILQFVAKKSYLQQSYLLPAKTLLKTPPLGKEQISAQFSTVFPVKIHPLQLTSVRVEKSKQSIIHLHFQCDNNVTVNQLDLSELTLYLHAELNAICNLYYDLTKCVTETIISIPDSKIQYKNIVSIRHCNLRPQDTLLPNSTHGYAGYSLLLDYFCFREKYFFIAVIGLDKIHWPPTTRQFILQLHCLQLNLSTQQPISEKHILLNCVPAINLYQTIAEPIHIQHDRSEYPLLTNISHAKGTQLFSVDSIIGCEIKSGKQYHYEPYTDFNYSQNKARIYAVKYQDIGAEFLQPYLQLGNVSESKAEILSSQITVCNGHYPRLYLHENTELHLVNANASMSAFNMTRPTAIIYPPQRNHWQWLLVSNLSLNYHTLADIGAFQKLLNLYNWSLLPENNRRILAMKQIAITPIKKMIKGIMVQGTLLSLTVDETVFMSIAEMFMFGQVIHSFLSSYAQINSYVQLKIICIPSQQELFWDEMMGINHLI